MLATSMRLTSNQNTKAGLTRRLLPLIALLMLALPFVEPFTRGLYPVTDDGMLALIRLVGLDHAMRHGAIWPRFMPALHYGYGSPIFNYSGPLSLYPAGLFHLLGMNFINALLWATVVWGLFGMLGTYKLGRSLGSPVVGIVAAVGFLYSGQFDYFGNIAQFAALSFLPWALWAVRLLARERRRRDFLLAVVFIAAPVLTHNITAMVSAALVAAYAVYLVLTAPAERRGKTALALAGAVAGALGVTAVVWLPAMAERSSVLLSRLSFFDYRLYFVRLANMFVLPGGDDPNRWFFPAGNYAIHWPQLLLAAAAIIAALLAQADRREHWRKAGYYLAAFAGLVFLATNASRAVWAVVPLMDYIEFPKRLLLPAALMLAVLAGLGADGVMRRIKPGWGRAAWLALCAGGIIAYSLPQLDLTYHDPQPVADTVIDVQAIERETGWLSGTSAGEYLPVWVSEDAITSSRFTDRFVAHDVFPRLEANGDVQVLDQAWGLVSGDVQLEAAQPTTLIFEWFYFPGWRAWVDGEEVEASPSDPAGLLAVDVPQGTHEVRVRFGLTPLRRAATAASLVVLAAVLIFAWRTKKLWHGDAPTAEEDPPLLSLPVVLAVTTLLGVGLLAASLLV